MVYLKIMRCLGVVVEKRIVSVPALQVLNNCDTAPEFVNPDRLSMTNSMP